jgi:hypothetical protein
MLRPPPWDGTKGGVLVIVAREITIEDSGLINANGCGYRGGRAKHGQGESWNGLGQWSSSPNEGGGGASFAPSDDDIRFGGAGGSFATEGSDAAVNDAKYDSIVGQQGKTYNPFSQECRKHYWVLVVVVDLLWTPKVGMVAVLLLSALTRFALMVALFHAVLRALCI